MYNNRFTFTDSDIVMVSTSDNSLETSLNFNPVHDKDGRFGGSGSSKAGKSSRNSYGISGPNSLTTNSINKIADDMQSGKIPLQTTGGGNAVLQAIYAKQGYNTKPTIVANDKFEKSSKGKTVLYRGIKETGNTPNQYSEEFKHGKEHFPGNGLFGNGTYTSSDSSIAMDYSNTGDLMRMYLKSGAKGISYKQAANEGVLAEAKMMKKSESIRKLAAKNKDMSLKKKADALLQLSHEIRDPGQYAAIAGYDYVSVANGEAVVILNRGKVSVDEYNYIP